MFFFVLVVVLITPHLISCQTESLKLCVKVGKREKETSWMCYTHFLAILILHFNEKSLFRILFSVCIHFISDAIVWQQLFISWMNGWKKRDCWNSKFIFCVCVQEIEKCKIRNDWEILTNWPCFFFLVYFCGSFSLEGVLQLEFNLVNLTLSRIGTQPSTNPSLACKFVVFWPSYYTS